MLLERFAYAAGVSPKWVQNTERTLRRRFPRTAAGVRMAIATRVLHVDVGLSLPRAGALASEVSAAGASGTVQFQMGAGIASLEVDLGRLHVACEAGLAAERESGSPARGRPRRAKGATARERAVAFGVDPTLLDASLAMTPAHALTVFQVNQRALAGLYGAALVTSESPAVREAPPPGVPALALDDILRRLSAAAVRFVVVGGIAGRVHRSHRMTDDLDLCYDPSDDNRERLAAVLAPLDPSLRGAPAGLPFVLDRRMLRAAPTMTLVTRAGWIDVMDRVAGVGDWDAVRRASERVQAFGIAFDVLTLPALIAAKRAANRVKDQLALPELEALLELRRTRAPRE